ncbi:MAG TPA: proline racemase family protein [Fimbriimonadaceae bacterium]
MDAVRKVYVVDSHTEGEPTRVIVKGGPKLSYRFLPDCVRELRDFHDGFRSGVIQEPRCSEAAVGALLMPPTTEGVDTAVIFFNNAGYLGMCGHGTIGLVETLRHLGKCQTGELKIETPVGIVRAVLNKDGRISVYNVKSYRFKKDVELEMPGYGSIKGDISYGGNWFFITEDCPAELSLQNVAELTGYTTAIYQALRDQHITGERDALIDHIEVSGPPQHHLANSRNFVLCPGFQYDRSPCGTGTSAKIACLAADGKLSPGSTYVQESVCGTLFEASYTKEGDGVLPCITGRAYITGEATLFFYPDDPLANGICVSTQDKNR